MTPKPTTLRGQLSLMIAIMGGIGLLCSVFIVNLFVDQILTDQHIASLELIKQETETETEKHKLLMEELGLRIQNDAEFRTAMKEHNFEIVQEHLNDEFFQYFITARVLNVNKIYVFNKQFDLLTQSTEGKNYAATEQFCRQLPAKAKLRTGVDRLRTLNSFCFFKQHTFHSVIIPVGTISPIGYVQIISEPQNIFQHMEAKLSMPMRIESGTSEVGYESKNWNKNPSENLIEIRYPLKDIDDRFAGNIVMQKDISAVRQSYSKSRLLIIVFVSCITLAGIFLFLFIFEKSMLKPLNRLAKQLTIMKQDKNNFGKQLELEGSPEIVSLTENFNGLTNKLANLYDKLEDMAFTDQLTSLPNRSRLQEILDFHASLNQRDNTPFALFMMDLDRFKSVNDTLGHHAGDNLLQQVSERLEKVLRKSDYVSIMSEQDASLYISDVVARLGGDEFAAILPAIDNIEDVIKIAKKILDVMNQPFIIDNVSFSVGVSIGIVMCPTHGRNSEILMQHADAAMYQAKENQKGYAVYDSSHDKNTQYALTLDADLRKAINDNSLSLAYQPKIDLRSQKVVGVEALLRWTHKDLGFIPPDQFIPIAEQSNLINDVTNWVIRNGLQQKSQWGKLGISLSLAINLSAKNLLDKNLIANITKELQLSAVDPESLYLELTETAVMSDPAHAIIVMRQLYDMGVRISIDDFGTGYSSLSYLKKLPVDEIKIDRSFVMDMEHDGNDAIIVQSTIDLAHNMGLRVIAEGVENQIILNDLGRRTCDLAQGFYMAKPMNNEELLEWLENSPWGIKK